MRRYSSMDDLPNIERTPEFSMRLWWIIHFPKHPWLRFFK